MNGPLHEDSLRASIVGLADDDILALCYGLGQDARRLRLYLDVLRGRGGEQAQFAACLICFDLGSRGDAQAQRDFQLVAQALQDVAGRASWLTEQLATAPYLAAVWQRCEAALVDLDPLAPAPAPDPKPAAQLPLLSDADFVDFRIDADDRSLWRRFDEAVEAFLGGIVGVPVYDQSAGFRLAGRRDTERVEAFLSQLHSLANNIGPARGFRALTLLFLGAHLRPRGLFGAVNARKQQLLSAGLAEFFREAPRVWQVVGVFSSNHADPEVWPKVAAVVLAHLRWLAADPSHPELAIAAYDPVSEATARAR